MRLTEMLKEGKKLVSELVSELDDVELAFYQHNPADIEALLEKLSSQKYGWQLYSGLHR